MVLKRGRDTLARGAQAMPSLRKLKNTVAFNKNNSFSGLILMLNIENVNNFLLCRFKSDDTVQRTGFKMMLDCVAEDYDPKKEKRQKFSNHEEP